MMQRNHGARPADRHDGRRRWPRRLAALGLPALLAGTGLVAAPAAVAVPGHVPASRTAGPAHGVAAPSFSSGRVAGGRFDGGRIVVFTPTESEASIQAELDAISTEQVPNQFGAQRYAVFFEPGTYGSAADPLIFQIGFYTEVAGLGALPQDVVINGEALVLNQCVAGVCNGTDNFWRSLSNLTIDVTTPPAGAATPVGAVSPPSGDPYGTGCDTSGEIYAASQAMPIRRVVVDGDLTLQDYCSPTGYVSGGYIADSDITGDIDFDGQQQYLVRNSAIGGSSNSVWNMTFSGVTGAPAPVFTGTGSQYTTLPDSPVTEEEPFLTVDAHGRYGVFVPAVEHDSSGPAFTDGTEAGRTVPIDRFFVADPGTPVRQIDRALALGRDLILEPGVYDLRSPIVVSRPDTVVVGLGFATLVAERGNAAMVVLPDRGVRVSGLIVDAGPVDSPVLMSVGTPGRGRSASGDPDVVQDVYFRVGGAETGRAEVSFLDAADHSIIDDLWAWRADHGNPGTVGWTVNTAATGVVVTGDDVTAYGLAVEHYQKAEVVWAGQGGTEIFYQNENPYDPPSQSAWMAGPDQDGYPAFLVTPDVRTFDGYGMGSYAVFIDTPATITSSEAFESPDTPGVRFHDIFDLYIQGTGGFDSVINGVGGPATAANATDPVDVTSYP
jgi:hypothetical protein